MAIVTKNGESDGEDVKQELREIRAALGRLEQRAANGCDDDELLTEEDVSKIFRLQPRMMREWRSSRGLPFIKLSAKVVRFRRKDVREWVAQHRTAIRA